MMKQEYKMKYIWLALGLCLLFFHSNSQDKKGTRQDRKETRKIQMELDYQHLNTLLESRKFVLKLERELAIEQVEINPLFNFLEIDSLNCKFHTEHKYYLLLRKVPDDPIIGKIESWKLVKDKKHLRYHLQFKMSTWFSRFDIFMTIESDKTASGKISSDGNPLPFQGYIKPL